MGKMGKKRNGLSNGKQIVFYIFCFGIFTYGVGDSSVLGKFDFERGEDNLLFKKYPQLRNKIPYIKLGDFPTPVTRLKRLGEVLDAKYIYLKNDGLSGGLLFGGNKVRKLEFLLADAIYSGATSVVIPGDVGSNFVAATALYAKICNLKTYAMLTPQPNASYVRRNLLMSFFYGANMIYSHSSKIRDIKIDALREKLFDKEGNYPYCIPKGGSCPISVLAYINAALELKRQIDKELLLEPDYIYVSLGSAGTAAGLILGIKLAGLKSRIVAVCSTKGAAEQMKMLKDLIEKTNKFLHGFVPDCPTFVLSKLNFEVVDDFSPEGYAHSTESSAEAIKTLHDLERIKLEGSYTGPTIATMISDIRNRNLKNKTILYWNTFCYGSFSHLTNKINYECLPENLHDYFECELPELDQGL